MRSFLLILPLASCVVFAPGGVGLAESDRDASWEFRIGPVYRTDTQIQADWSGEAVAAHVAPLFTRRSSGSPAVGPITGYADRDYVDGFVYMDPGTADPETDVVGLTWYWGYDDPGQYSGDSVQFHGSPVEEYRAEGLAMEPWS